MPAPLAQPMRWMRLPDMRKEAEAVLGLVSVVQMASESSAVARKHRNSAQNFLGGKLDADDAGGADEDFLRLKAKAFGRFFHGAKRGEIALCASCAVGIA